MWETAVFVLIFLYRNATCRYLASSSKVLSVLSVIVTTVYVKPVMRTNASFTYSTSISLILVLLFPIKTEINY